MRFARRLAITLSIPILIGLLLEQVLVPGIPYDALGIHGSRANLSVFALGLQPILTAYWIVEVVAFLVPRWSRLRHGNPEGRAKLDSAVRILVLVLAVTQALGMALSLKALGDGQVGLGFSISVPLVMMSLVGGVCIQFVAARIISTHGLMNGFVVLFGASLLRGIVLDLLKMWGPEAPERHGFAGGDLNPLAIVVVIVATWAALRGAGRAPDAPAKEGSSNETGAPYRSARWLVVHPWIPVPSGSIQPYYVASALLLLPATLVNLGLPLQELQRFLQRGDAAFTLLFLALSGITMVVFARLMHRPSEMAGLASRLGAAEGKKLERQAGESLRRATLPSLLLLAAIILSPTRFGGATVALLTVMLMDLFAAIRLAQKEPDLVSVWEERRVSAVPVLRAALAAEGIATETRGMAYCSFWQIFAPYAPTELLVKRADAERATQTLRLLLLGEEDPEPDAPRAPRWQVPTEPWTPARRTAILGGCAVAALALTAFGALPAHDSGGDAVPRADLEVVRVDDTVDPFAALPDDAAPAGLGLSIMSENAPVGPGRNTVAHFARVVLQSGETTQAAFARVKPWLSTLRLRPGARFGFEELDEYDDDTRKATPVGIRTFVLAGAPVLRTDDVTDAAVAMDSNGDEGPPSYYVAVTLSSDAAKRFEAATREWTERRLAILIDGEINSAPVVKTAIGGGHISITMGQGDPAQQLKKAKQLARGLGVR
jgi:SecY